MGWLFRDLQDAPRLGGLFAQGETKEVRHFDRFAVVGDNFLEDCEAVITAGLRATSAELEGLGLRGAVFDAGSWADAFSIFAPIQAWEAARIHAGNFDRIESSIRERLEWGARITAGEIAGLRVRHAEFRAHVDALLAEHGLLLMPATPVARLDAGADHSQTRGRLLRYTVPFSLAGVPVVTIPCAVGGMQLAAARGCDGALLEFAAQLGARRKNALQA
jgi:Asp-tRNA(Asn)/Glu-tRNA(Gln) amidotransferase A subunit family amidase